MPHRSRRALARARRLYDSTRLRSAPTNQTSFPCRVFGELLLASVMEFDHRRPSLAYGCHYTAESSEDLGTTRIPAVSEFVQPHHNKLADRTDPRAAVQCSGRPRRCAPAACAPSAHTARDCGCNRASSISSCRAGTRGVALAHCGSGGSRSGSASALWHEGHTVDAAQRPRAARGVHRHCGECGETPPGSLSYNTSGYSAAQIAQVQRNTTEGERSRRSRAAAQRHSHPILDAGGGTR